MSDPPPEEGDNCLLSQSALWQPALVATPNGVVCISDHCLCSLLEKDHPQWRERAATVHCIDSPRHWAGCQIASASSAVCQYKTLSVHCSPWVKVFSVTVVGFVENCWVSPLERDRDCGLAQRNVAPHCPQSRIWRPACCLLMVSHLSSFMPLEPTFIAGTSFHLLMHHSKVIMWSNKRFIVNVVFCKWAKDKNTFTFFNICFLESIQWKHSCCLCCDSELTKLLFVLSVFISLSFF